MSRHLYRVAMSFEESAIRLVHLTHPGSALCCRSSATARHRLSVLMSNNCLISRSASETMIWPTCSPVAGSSQRKLPSLTNADSRGIGGQHPRPYTVLVTGEVSHLAAIRFDG